MFVTSHSHCILVAMFRSGEEQPDSIPAWGSGQVTLQSTWLANFGKYNSPQPSGVRPLGRRWGGTWGALRPSSPASLPPNPALALFIPFLLSSSPVAGLCPQHLVFVQSPAVGRDGITENKNAPCSCFLAGALSFLFCLSSSVYTPTNIYRQIQ